MLPSTQVVPFEGASLISRRQFIRHAQWAPVIFLPAPLNATFRLPSAGHAIYGTPAVFSEAQFSPHYPSSSPLDEMLRLVLPGSDSYIVEKYVAELQDFFQQWTDLLLGRQDWQRFLAQRLRLSLESNIAAKNTPGAKSRWLYGIEFAKRSFGSSVLISRDSFLYALRSYFGKLAKISSAEFQIVRAKLTSQDPALFASRFRRKQRV